MSDLDRAMKFYRTFHGRKPARIIRFPRPAWYAGPGTLVVMGRASAINYEPFDSDKDGVEYVHQFGDYGDGVETDEKPLLCTDPEGKDLFLIKEGSKFHVEDERGIVG